MKTYYEILGVKPDASNRTIKTAYRKLIKQFHPDINKTGGKFFAEISSAYSALIDPDKRAEYDEKLRSREKKKAAREFKFREFRAWLASVPVLRTVFVSKRVSSPKKPKPEIDKSVLALPPEELLQRVMYSTNVYVQTNAVRALFAKKKAYIISDLLRLLYSNIPETVKREIINGIKDSKNEKVQAILNDRLSA
jgi:hypothetical protein